jgi:hypothetical protein
VGVLAYAFVRAGRRRTGDRRATLTGAGSGLLFGVADALTRRTVEIMDNHSFAAVLTSWPAYGTIAATLLGLWLMESAFNAGPVHASLPGVTAGEPVAGMLLGVLVFGDVVRVSAGMIALQAAGLAALVAGVVMVARGPALSGLRPSRPVRRSRGTPAQAPAAAGGPAAVIAAPAHPGSVSPPAGASASPD